MAASLVLAVTALTGWGVGPASAQEPPPPSPTTTAPPVSLSPPTSLQVLSTPAPPNAPVAPGATAGRVSAPEWFPLRHDLDGDAIKVGCTYLSYGGSYDCAGHHPFWALDLMASQGTPIYAAGAGYATIGEGGKGFSGYGNVVVVDHGLYGKSLYAHMSLIEIPPQGEWVDADTEIGKVGQTGDATAPHLHYEKSITGSFGSGSEDPGPLKACWGPTLLSYPAASGRDSWKGIPWGAMTAGSSGTSCGSATLQSTAGGPVGVLADQVDLWLANLLHPFAP
ncbi:MAG TPA: M23 family metallopeptidase [Acidimicrobiales bacterium]